MNVAAPSRVLGAAAVIVAAILFYLFSSVPQAHAVESAAEKTDYPVVITHLIQEDSDSIWYSEADFAQGQDIPFCVVSSLPENIQNASPCPYWIVVRTDSTFNLKSGSMRVVLNRADGTTRDVTSNMAPYFSSGTIIAGSADVNSAVPGLKSSDTFSLYYTMRFADKYRYGYRNGNSNYAHLEFDGASFVEDDVADTGGIKTASTADEAPDGFASILVEKAYAAASGPAAGLSSSPEVKVTAYTYSIDIMKRAEKSSKLLAGASFAVHDDDGRWYVRGDSWSSVQADATVFTTDVDGRAAIVGLDADRYDLVEVGAPNHYLPVGPIDVLIESDVARQGDAMRVTSKTATVEKVDAAEGTILIDIDDPEDPADPDPDPDGPGGVDPQDNPDDPEDPNDPDDPGDPDDPDDPAGPGSQPGSGGTRGTPSGGSAISQLGSQLAKLGDKVPLAGLAALTLAVALVAAVAYRAGRRNGGYESRGQLTEGVAFPHERKEGKWVR